MIESILSPNSEEAAKQAGKVLGDILKREEGRSVLLLLAGGSSFSVLEYTATDSLGPLTAIIMSDERWGEDPKASNFAQLAKTNFFAGAIKRQVPFIDTRTQEGESLNELATRFEGGLKTWLKTHPRGLVFMLQGIGPDGHTCGIMPYPEDPEKFNGLFEDSRHWVVGYDAKNKNEYPKRVTVTMPFLHKRVTLSLVYAVGEAKRSALKRVLAKEGALAETPARILKEMRQVTLFTDQRL